MSTNQMHGKKFEDIIKSSFPGASDSFRRNTNKWDIESYFDKERQLATSVKTSKTIIIGLSDARSFMLINEPFRILVGIYIQERDVKKFIQIREYYITPEILAYIKGDLTYEDVEAYHNEIKTRAGKEGQILAREIVAKWKFYLQYKNFLLILNPKIDSKNQRRLQCSLNLSNIERLQDIEFYVYTREYRDIIIPISIKSSEREFNS
jgi:hypothetical protein